MITQEATLLVRKWPWRDLNTQPSDLESDALPLRHRVFGKSQLNNLLANKPNIIGDLNMYCSDLG